MRFLSSQAGHLPDLNVYTAGSPYVFPTQPVSNFSNLTSPSDMSTSNGSQNNNNLSTDTNTAHGAAEPTLVFGPQVPLLARRGHVATAPLLVMHTFRLQVRIQYISAMAFDEDRQG